MIEAPIHFVGKLAPDFVGRLQEQRDILCRLESDNGDTFPMSRGDYSDCKISRFKEYDAPDIDSEDPYAPELKGIESVIAAVIRKKLDAQSGPCIALDIGGMAGLTWSKLAYRFKDEVDQGKAIFVVANISFDLNSQLSEIYSIQPHEKRFLYTNQCRVKYIHADSNSIDSKYIYSRKGDKIFLKNNVDILHERASVTLHSSIPEWDITKYVLSLLSDTGIYFVHDNTPAQFFANKSIERWRQREKGILYAREELQRRGLINVLQVEGGERSGERLVTKVYKKPSALPIILP